MRAYLIVFHRREAYKDKKKTMSDVKFNYLFFKVDKCSDLVGYGRIHTHGTVAGRSVSQSVNLLPVGRSQSRDCGSMSQATKLLSVDRSPSRGFFFFSHYYRLLQMHTVI